MADSTLNQRWVCVTTANQLFRCGSLELDNGREVHIRTQEIGLVIIPKSEVISIQDAEPGNTSQVLNPLNSRGVQDVLTGDRAPQSSRYFFAPSALPMEQGESYAHLNLLSVNATTQVSEHVMLGAALSFLGVGMNLKVSTQLANGLHGSVGGMFLLGFADIGPTLFPYVNVTSGDHNNHTSFAIAALSFDGEVSPMMNLSVCREINPRVWFISENYFFLDPIFFEERLLLSIGGRWWSTSKNRLGEFALVMAVDENGRLYPAPWFGRTWPF